MEGSGSSEEIQGVIVMKDREWVMDSKKVSAKVTKSKITSAWPAPKEQLGLMT